MKLFKSQSMMEYLLLLAGLLMLIVLISVIVRGGIFGTASTDIGNSVSTIKAYTSALATAP